jgi:hypothetical protein
MLFPNDLGLLQQVHTVHGYSALQPRSAFLLLGMKQAQPAEVADYIYRSGARGLDIGDFQKLRPDGGARYRADNSEVRITTETLDTLTLTTTGTAPILRTDTSYPGWQASSGAEALTMEPVPPAFTSLTRRPDTATPIRIGLHYQPTHFQLTIVIAGTALISIVLLSAIPNRARR